MKNFNYLLLMFLLPAFILTGCNDNDDKDTITVTDKTELAQEAYADEEIGGTVTFTATASWTATVREETTTRAQGIDWLELDKYQGQAGEFTITITLRPNYTGEKRTAKIDIQAGEVVTITIVQRNVTKDGSVPKDPDAVYSITASGNEHGSAVADVETAKAGETVTLTATPDNGYVFKQWTVESGNVTFEDITVNPATFTMPAEAVGIKAEFITLRELYGIETAYITAGTFTMGSPADEYGHNDNEIRHIVKLTQNFYMGKYEITNTQYTKFLNANNIGADGKGTVANGSGSTIQKFATTVRWGMAHDGTKWVPHTGYENHPAAGISWYGAKAFADWVGGSLPTEAQWEYACRAATTTAYSYGNTANNDYMWNYNATPGYTPGEVGTKLPNAWGLYDMHGNVWEWCSDRYDDNYGLSATQLTGTAIDPDGPASTIEDTRVSRGGSFSNSVSMCRSAFRMSGDPATPVIYTGFRVIFY
jgi:formylglycine-generating enzyme required for sulfatase activity